MAVAIFFSNIQNQQLNAVCNFPAQHEHKEVCAVEAMYGRIAKASGLRVPVMDYFDLGKDLSAFGIERFDRSNGMRIPMHTAAAAAAAHVDFRIPQLDYVALLRLTQLMTRDVREVQRAFNRCDFNVVFNNRDDHSTSRSLWKKMVAGRFPQAMI
jgi:serine/threonine-protein kinase HipA